MSTLSPLPAAAAAPTAAPTGRLALLLEDVLTATARLRGGRQLPASAEAFRAHLHQLLEDAERDARDAGYPGRDVRLALFAVVAFLDEAVLNSAAPVFAGWSGRLLQQELFGANVAGEAFFGHLDQLLERDDSAELADVLEVFHLCLLLGYRGRHAGQDGALQQLVRRTGERIARIRGQRGELAPAWRPPDDRPTVAPRDPWVRRLAVAAAAVVALAVLLAATFGLLLAGDLAELQRLAAP